MEIFGKINIILFSILGLTIGFKIAQFIYQKRIDVLQRKVSQNLSAKKENLNTLDLEDILWHEQEAEFIFKLFEQLSLSLTREKVTRYIVECIYKFLYVQRVVLLLLDNDTNELRMGCYVDLERNISENFVLQKDESISGFVMTEKRPLIVDNLNDDYYLKKLNKEDYLRKSFVSMPLIFQEEVVGVLHVCEKRQDDVFTKRDISFITNVAKVAALSLQNVRLYEQIQNDYLKTIATLASAIDARDHYTEWHSENVAKYSLAIAGEMKYPHSQVETLRRAALLHDIGKIGIKDDILLKVDKLTEQEYEQFKVHPATGETIIKSLPFLKGVSVLMRHHHERYDGAGYPDRIAADKIELGARVLAVADSFDAMTSDRAYRKALPVSEAIKELQSNKGTQFDPLVVESFLKALEKNPAVFDNLK